MEAVLVELDDPFGGGGLEVVEALPVAAVGGEHGRVAVQLGLEQSVDRFGHRVSETVDDDPTGDVFGSDRHDDPLGAPGGSAGAFDRRSRSAIQVLAGPR